MELNSETDWQRRLDKSYVAKKPRNKAPKKRTGLKPQSAKGRDRTMFIRGILAAKLRAQESLPRFAHHGYTCEDCNRSFGGSFLDALFAFDPGHIVERFQGKGFDYAAKSVGTDDPGNIKVQCPPCNKAQNDQRSDVRWSER
jgi:hypothetical protein